MLITCPACDARYRASDAHFPATGRAVRCSACNAEWTVWPDAPGAAPPVASDGAAVAPEPESIPAEFFALPSEPTPPPDAQFARSLEAPEESRGAGGFLWGFAAAAALAVAAVLTYARHAEIAAAAPQLAGALDAYVVAVDALRARLAEIAEGVRGG